MVVGTWGKPCFPHEPPSSGSRTESRASGLPAGKAGLRPRRLGTGRRGTAFSLTSMLTMLRILHVLSASVWVGGHVALVFVGVPAIRKLEGDARATAMRALGRRWRPLGWGAMAVAILSGLWLTELNGGFSRAALDTDFDRTLIVKSVLVALLVVGALDPRLRPRPAAPARAEAQTRRLPRRDGASSSSAGSTSRSRSRSRSSAPSSSRTLD